ncbi:hypothetical protein D3C85_1692780 [compost metagenome]
MQFKIDKCVIRIQNRVPRNVQTSVSQCRNTVNACCRNNSRILDVNGDGFESRFRDLTEIILHTKHKCVCFFVVRISVSVYQMSTVCLPGEIG